MPLWRDSHDSRAVLLQSGSYGSASKHTQMCNAVTVLSCATGWWLMASACNWTCCVCLWQVPAANRRHSAATCLWRLAARSQHYIFRWWVLQFGSYIGRRSVGHTN